MKISELIEELKNKKKQYGEIEVTCTASFLKDGNPKLGFDDSKVWESTVENLIVQDNEVFGKHLRIYM